MGNGTLSMLLLIGFWILLFYLMTLPIKKTINHIKKSKQDRQDELQLLKEQNALLQELVNKNNKGD